MARRCSAERPLRPKRSRSPRTTDTVPGLVTRPRADPRSEEITSEVFVGKSSATAVFMISSSYSFCISSALMRTSEIPIQPESGANSARYSSAVRPIEAAFTLMGRSLDTTVTASPSWARFDATARMRESLSPSWSPLGRTDWLEWLSSTRSDPPSPTAIGKSNRS